MLKPLFSLLLVCLFWSLSAQSTDCSLGLVATSVQAEAGDEVTIDITTRQFNAIVAMQYSHEWDPNALEFIEILYNQDLDILPTDFNLSPEYLNQGILNFVHLNPSLQGTSLADGAVLYSLRFEVLTANETDLSLLPLGEIVEFVDETQTVLQNFYFVHGKVGAASSYPTVASACLLPQACDNPDLGRIDILPAGTESLSLAWTSPGGYMGSGPSISGLNAEVYDMTLTDALGNAVDGNFYLGSEAELTVNLSVDADLCGEPADGSVSTSVSGGSGNYSYQWSNGASTASIEAVPAGTYEVTITDVELGCSITATATVQSNSTLIGYFSGVNPSCEANADGSLTINVEGTPEMEPFTYAWSNGATGETATDLLQGAYTVTVTDATGCSATFSTFLLADVLQVSADIVNAECEASSGSISLQLEPGDYSFSWSNGASTSSIDNLAVGTYEVTITDNSTSCSTSASYDVLGEELVAAWNYECFYVDGAYMADLSVIIWNPSDGPYQFNWSNGMSTSAAQLSTITVPANDAYSVTITSASGCEVVVDEMTTACGEDQIQLFLTPSEVSIANGESRCFTVQVDNFEEIGGLQFTLSWDETKLTFDELGELYLPGVLASNFNTNLVDDGLLSVSWIAPDLITGVSLADGSPLFEICLSGATSAETTTNLTFTDFPTPMEITDVDLNTLGVTTQSAQINLNGDGGNGGQSALQLPTTEVSPGDQFCVSVTTQSFTGIIGMQGTISWDPDALQYIGPGNFNLPNLTDNSFGNLAEAELEGFIRFLWSDPNLQGVTIPDNSSLFDLCFIASGSAGTYPLEFAEEPLGLELVNTDLENVSVVGQAGQVTINEQADDEVSLEIVSAAVSAGETICVPIRAVQFSEIVGMQFSMTWDEDRIHFNSLNLPENALGLDPSTFNIDGPAGNLRFSWVSGQLDPVSLSSGTTLFELCFTAQSIPGPAGILFTSTPTQIEFIRGNTTVPFIPVNGTLTISDDNLVWPGDTNNDGVANHLDVFPLGLGFSLEGSERNNPSTAWLPQYAPLWPENTPTSEVNFRHADANGDGIIAIADSLALSLNWGQTIDGFGEPEVPGSFFTGASIYIEADTLQAGVPARLPIMLGADETVEQAFGLAFTLRYDPETVEAGSIHIEPNGWLLGDEGEHLLMYRDYPSDGRVEVGMVRLDGQGVSGEGQIAEFVIIMEDVILRNLIDVETFFKIEDVELITPGEVELPTAPRETTVLVEGVTNTNEIPAATMIQIAPNPTVGLVQIQVGALELQQIQLLDARGRSLMLTNTPTDTVDLSNYPAGVYYLRVSTDQGVMYEKVIKH